MGRNEWLTLWLVMAVLFSSIPAFAGMILEWEPVWEEGKSVVFAPPPPTRSSYVDPVTGMEFVLVPGGCFKMGDSFGDGGKDEKPVHEVCLPDFYLGKYEVTNAQYRKSRPLHDSGSYDGSTLDGDNQPVVKVSWNDAVEFARWLSGLSGKVYRLPTEAEWEYAARGGASGRNYWGDGEDACAYGNVADDSARRRWPEWTGFSCDDGHNVTAPVGSYKPNPFGLFDMMGNVWEWTGDWYDKDYYAHAGRRSPAGPYSGSDRIRRGGGWDGAPQFIRASYRSSSSPGSRYAYLGFRLLLIPQ